MKLLPIAILAALATVASAQQSLPAPFLAGPADADLQDCRTPDLAIGTKCIFRNTDLFGVVQRFLGYIAEPGSPQVGMTEPLTAHSAIVPAVHRRNHITLGGMYSLQTETLDLSAPRRNGRYYVPNNHASDGFTLYAKRQWSDLRGLEVRGEVIRYDTLTPLIRDISLNGGDNHSYSATFGPSLQHSFGRVTPYFTAEAGYIYQYRSGLKVLGAAGMDLKASKRVTVRLGDMEYGYALAQHVRPRVNPLHGRIKLSTGVAFHF